VSASRRCWLNWPGVDIAPSTPTRRIPRNRRREQLWREDRIAALLAEDGPLFVQGTTRNQVVFYPLFDHIVLLSAPAEVLVERLTTRTTNPYGKNPGGD
jgi:hypothetical protein